MATSWRAAAAAATTSTSRLAANTDERLCSASTTSLQTTRCSPAQRTMEESSVTTARYIQRCSGSFGSLVGGTAVAPPSNRSHDGHGSSRGNYTGNANPTQHPGAGTTIAPRRSTPLRSRPTHSAAANSKTAVRHGGVDEARASLSSSLNLLPAAQSAAVSPGTCGGSPLTPRSTAAPRLQSRRRNGSTTPRAPRSVSRSPSTSHSASPSILSLTPTHAARGSGSLSNRETAVDLSFHPWQCAAPTKGILKNKNPNGVLCNSGPGKKTTTSAAEAPPLRPSSGAATRGSAINGSDSPLPKHHRRVQFDEANLKFLNSTARHVVHQDGEIGLQLDQKALRAILLSPTAPEGRPRMHRLRSVPLWGEDSEWFNRQFGISAASSAHTSPHERGGHEIKASRRKSAPCVMSVSRSPASDAAATPCRLPRDEERFSAPVLSYGNKDTKKPPFDATTMAKSLPPASTVFGSRGYTPPPLSLKELRLSLPVPQALKPGGPGGDGRQPRWNPDEDMFSDSLVSPGGPPTASEVSPLSSAAPLSAGERRLLRAVVFVHPRRTPVRASGSVSPETCSGRSSNSRADDHEPPVPPMSPLESAPSLSSLSTRSASGCGALRSATRALGNPAAAALSSEVRQFLAGSEPTQRRRAASTSTSLQLNDPQPRHPSVGGTVAVQDGANSSVSMVGSLVSCNGNCQLHNLSRDNHSYHTGSASQSAKGTSSCSADSPPLSAKGRLVTTGSTRSAGSGTPSAAVRHLAADFENEDSESEPQINAPSPIPQYDRAVAAGRRNSYS